MTDLQNLDALMQNFGSLPPLIFCENGREKGLPKHCENGFLTLPVIVDLLSPLGKVNYIVG